MTSKTLLNPPLMKTRGKLIAAFVAVLLVLGSSSNVFGCDQSLLKLDSIDSLGPGLYKVWMTVCIGGGFTPPDTAGANNYTTDFYFEVFGKGVQILKNSQPNQYYPDFLNSGQSAAGCTNCRNACVSYGGTGFYWLDPSCTDITQNNDTTCYGCGGPSTATTHCPDTNKCPNGPGTCIWYSANNPCCNAATASSSCNINGFNYYSFWGIPFKPSTCPGPPNSGVGCRNWAYTDIWNGSGKAQPYCDTMFLVVTGCPDSIVIRGVENTSGFSGDCWTGGAASKMTVYPNVYDCDYCPNVIRGRVWYDADSNCVMDSLETPLPGWVMEAVPGPWYGMTNSQGFYVIYAPVNNYTIQPVTKKPYWELTCPPSGKDTANFSIECDTSGYHNFGQRITDTCAHLYVDIGTPLLRRCSYAKYTVKYANYGSVAAHNVTITVQIDTLLTFLSSTLPVASSNNGLYTFNIGTVQPQQVDTFSIKVAVTCKLLSIGVIQCTEANIYPNLSCDKPDTIWDKSSVKVWGYCQGDSFACFVIKNTGSPTNGNMQGTSQYRIYENNVLVLTSNFQLAGGDSIIICWPANGNSIRLEADQRPGHPGKSKPNDVVNMCGASNPVLGMTNILPQDDYEDYKSIDCHPIIYPYDPNNKEAVPIGLTANHYVDQDETLEYQINFQNTGSDTAFNVKLVDTISSDLDLGTLVFGASSHYYQASIKGPGVLQFLFSNIMLPDSNVNEPASHGFVKYKIEPKAGLPKGTVIENFADIYFDYELPVRTDTTFHTLWDTMLNGIPISLPSAKPLSVTVYPNPVRSTVIIKNNDPQMWRYEFYDIFGRKMRAREYRWIKGKLKIEVDISDFPAGVIYWRVESRDGRRETGKLIKL